MRQYTHACFNVSYAITLVYFFFCTSQLISDFSWFSSYKYEREEHIEITPKHTPCTLCIKHTVPGNISLTGWHENHIAVTAHNKTHTAEDADHVHSILTHHTKGTVILNTIVPDAVHKDVSVNLVIHVPTHTTIIIETQEDVLIKNMESSICIQTDNGTISTEDTKGPLQAHTVKGNITVDTPHGPVTVYTQKGIITICNSHNSITAEADRGTITVTCADVPSTTALSLKTHERGYINLNIPESTHAHIEADTTRGIITSNVLITLERHTTLLNSNTYKDSQRHIRGIIGERGNAHIVIQSARGIHISPTDIP